MTWTIGRTALTDRHGKDGGPHSVSQSGELLQIGGTVFPAGGLRAGRQFRQNMLGLFDTGEVVPVITDQGLDLTGFWRCSGAAFSAMPDTQNVGQTEYSVSLVRVPGGWARPNFEMQTETVLRPNVEGVTAASMLQVIAWPDSALSLGPSSTAPTVSTATGNIRRYTVANPGFLTASPTYGAGPADYYAGSCQIEILDYTLQVWPVFGRQLPEVAAIRISNGLIAVTIGTGISISRWTGSAWSAQVIVGFDAATANPWVPLASTVKVERNSVESCSVSWQMQDGVTPIQMSLTLTRGQYFAEFSTISIVPPAIISVPSGTWSSTGVGNQSRSSLLTSGFAVVVASPNMSIGGATVPTPGSQDGRVDFALGMATPANANTEVVFPFFAAQSVVQRVVT